MKSSVKRFLALGIRYLLLIGISVVFLYPVLYMVCNSLKSIQDLVNPTVEWLPSRLCWDNYTRALKTLDYGKTLPFTFLYTAVAAAAQTVCCAMAGYAFARHEFPLKRFWMVMLVAAFLVPAQVTLVPRYLMFFNYRLTNTLFAVWLPALLGQGVSSSIFFLGFDNFFSSYPKSFDEAAKLDGGGKFTIFFRVALPMVKPAIVVSILFSFVWIWNETYTSGQLMGAGLRTLPMKLESFVAEFTNIYSTASASGDMAARLNESGRLAATLLVVAPLMVLYMILQRSFIRGIDAASGLTGE